MTKTTKKITKKKAAAKRTPKKPASKAARFAKAYALFAVLGLFATTLFWAILGARLQQGNADQPANVYLFENAHTFHEALLPGQHSFLIKWPLFLLVRVFGSSQAAFSIFTVATVLLTVALLAFIIYRIERRPLVFSTIFLALASVLLLVPTMPYAGGLLPVNMAMLTTRNLEYLFYIAGLALLVWAPRIKSWKFLA